MLKGKGKGKGKGKDKPVYISKLKNPIPSAKEHPTKDDACHHCKEMEHCKRNFPAYLTELIKKKKKVGTASYSESDTRILNTVPTKKVDKTPYELWYGKVPNLSYLKVWGCGALVKRDTLDKLQERYVKCIFIGYPKETMGYYFYFLPENKTVVARYVEFLETNLISQEVSGRAIELEEIQDEDTSPSKNTSKIPMEVEEVEDHSLGDLNEPTNYKATMLDPESNKWLDAMNAKMVDYEETFSPVDDIRAPECLCLNVEVEEHSLEDLNEPTNYKATMVDYEETFSPVADIKAIRILIAIAAFYDYEIWQIDVKTAFLNGYLDEDIWVKAINALPTYKKGPI
ncbi:retrotransposon protein, putative, ty1-copia subclass [Tanacetum coccineum]